MRMKSDHRSTNMNYFKNFYSDYLQIMEQFAIDNP